MNVLRPKLKFFSLIGSYGWGGRIEEQVKGFLTNLKAEYLGSVLVKGEPVDKDFKNLDALTDKIYEKHKELGLLDKI
jgi:flavorubredoxin